MNTILVADDEISMIEMLEIMLGREGYKVITAQSTEKAIKTLDKKEIDLILSDIKIPEDGGISILRASMQRDRTRPVIMITAHGSAETAVEAMKIGAYDYITKPFNLDELKIIINNALEKRNLIMENVNLKRQLKQKTAPNDIIGRSEAIQSVRDIIARVAESNSTVLITGESGTGKELVARAVHAQSSRYDKPFLSINCGAMPEQLLESEMFGYKKGSFTGAVKDKVGLLEAAKGGSFFLDELGEMPLPLQVKLVRAIQEREIRPVGDVRDVKLDVRFLAATNTKLEDAVKEGTFREDLFYRLNVIQIDVPPLRERKVDIPILAKHFLDKHNALNSKVIKGFTAESMKIMEEYHWRGNVRELENAVERAVVLDTGKWIEPESLPRSIRFPSLDSLPLQIPGGGLDLEKQLDEIEQRIIKSALEQCSGSKREAAKLLNMNLRSFRYKIGKYDINS